MSYDHSGPRPCQLCSGWDIPSLPNSGWLTTERHIFELGGIQFHLKHDLTFREASQLEESWAGYARSTVALDDMGIYRSRCVDEDGHETELDLDSRPLIPDPTLATSVFPLIERQRRLSNSHATDPACHLLHVCAVVLLRNEQPHAPTAPNADGSYNKRIAVVHAADPTPWVTHPVQIQRCCA
jgi:hypothetical protein